MKTRIYVDGFNFYYGRLKRTPFKWLDPVKTFVEEAKPSHVTYSDYQIKYFTALISGKAASNDDSLKDQSNYLDALSAKYCEEVLKIHYGNFHVTKTQALHIEDQKNASHPRNCNKVSVWKMEEKQSDVSMAVEALSDVLTDGSVEQIVFVTNDSDQAPTLKKIRALRPNVQIGVICPIKKGSGRDPSVELVKHSDWSIQDIRNSWLKRSQLPRVISQNHTGKSLKRPRIKPDSWFGQPEIVSHIIETLSPYCKGKRAKCWKLLETRVPEEVGGQDFDDLPINMLDNKEDAQRVLDFVERFVASNPSQ